MFSYQAEIDFLSHRSIWAYELKQLNTCCIDTSAHEDQLNKPSARENWLHELIGLCSPIARCTRLSNQFTNGLQTYMRAGQLRSQLELICGCLGRLHNFINKCRSIARTHLYVHTDCMNLMLRVGRLHYTRSDRHARTGCMNLSVCADQCANFLAANNAINQQCQ